MFDIGPAELLIVLVIVVLLFGPGRLANTMGEIGKGLRAFKESLSSDETSESLAKTKSETQSDTNAASK